MIIRMNGHFVEEREAMVSIYDHGFLYGIGLFETFRTYKGKPYLLKEHLQRLEAGCNQLGIVFEPDEAEVLDTIQQLLKNNGLADAYFRYTVTAGTDILGLPSAEYDQPTVIVYVKSLPHIPPSLYEQGKPLQQLRTPRNTPEGAVRLKSLHYMNNILGKRELNQYPWSAGAEGLFMDRHGYVSEGIVSNVFFISGHILHTPSIDTGLLPGITRHAVMEMAVREGLEVQEGLYTWDELIRADEIFITNSIQEIVPISTLYDLEGCGTKVNQGKPGLWTKRLLAQYRKSIQLI